MLTEIKKLLGTGIRKQLKEVSIAPLASFRIIFGLMMLGGTLRFILNGWVDSLYIMPSFHFTYYGFSWIKPFGEIGMYITFSIMALSALFISLGFLYRLSSIVFFLSFTYIELIDKTTYLNHYYFISLVAFLMILLPANKSYSLDVRFNIVKQTSKVPAWQINVIMLQLGLVYFFAGIAKINSDWLIEAMPLKIWLPAHTDVPLIGSLFDHPFTAYAFSWIGMLYDISIPFLLLYKPTRRIAYLFVIVFHVLTAILFPIGMFPYIMILATLIFFPAPFHQKILSLLNSLFRNKDGITNHSTLVSQKLLRPILISFFAIQLLLPFRYLLYPGELFWTEQGYRFSWRVMLIEKAGTTFFYVKDQKSGRESEVDNAEFLTKFQEKMMSTQPDMILEYAHYLKQVYEERGYTSPSVRVESYVTLNGSGSKLFINPKIDLAGVKRGLQTKPWILPFHNKENLLLSSSM